ncbi:PAQR family membrane homeostasis protein TrhA [Oceanisphaera avium]|uniref:Hemolysin D n=1 Tax=Oceanisphaera avium TaxID=1903694 RepID=A0A1Y0CWE1_9GAMM|nr:hemolysin III family protein [Oceanisphaera avium]ART79324.1 hemolysin D [Oceanisphaera avium]
MFHSKRGARAQTRGEERANTLSHGLGLVVALIGGPLLIMQAKLVGDTAFIIGASIFALSIIFMYLSSAIYHGLAVGQAKLTFRVIEHCAIFLLIAGTYTPILLGVLNGAWGWSLLILVWSIALLGIGLKLFAQHLPLALSTTLYLLMGWVIIIAIVPLIAVMPSAGIYWLLAGGISYTLGVVFFILDDRLPYAHFIWHLWVLAGTCCHYLAIYWYGA